MDSDTQKTVGMHIEDGALMPITDAIREANKSELKAIAEIADILKGEKHAQNGELFSPNREVDSLFDTDIPSTPVTNPYSGEDKARTGERATPKSENLSPIGEKVTPEAEGDKREEDSPEREENSPAAVCDEFGRTVDAVESASTFVTEELEDDELSKNLGGMTAQLANLLKATEKLAEESKHESSVQQTQTEIHHAPSYQEKSETDNAISPVDSEPVKAHSQRVEVQPEIVVSPSDKAVSESSTEASSVTATEHHQAKESVSAKELVNSNSQTEKDASSEFKGYWKDDRGQLRHPTGRFATKDENKGYSKSQQAKEANDKEKELNLIGKLVKGVGSVAQGVYKASSGSVEEASAVAAGGSYTYAAKELFELGANTVEQISSTKEKFDTAKEKAGVVKDRVAEFNERRKARKANKQQNKKATKADKDRIRQVEMVTSAEAEKAKVLTGSIKAETTVVSADTEQSSHKSTENQVSERTSANSENHNAQQSVSAGTSSHTASNNSQNNRSDISSSDNKQESVSSKKQSATHVQSSTEKQSDSERVSHGEKATAITAVQHHSERNVASEAATDVAHTASAERSSSVDQLSYTSGIEKISESVSNEGQKNSETASSVNQQSRFSDTERSRDSVAKDSQKSDESASSTELYSRSSGTETASESIANESRKHSENASSVNQASHASSIEQVGKSVSSESRNSSKHASSTDQLTHASGIEKVSEYVTNENRNSTEHTSSVAQLSRTSDVEKISESVANESNKSALSSAVDSKSIANDKQAHTATSLHVENLSVGSAVVESLNSGSETVRHEQSQSESISTRQESQVSQTAISSQRHDSNTNHENESVVARVADRVSESVNESTTATDIHQQANTSTESISDIATAESQRSSEQERISSKSTSVVPGKAVNLQVNQDDQSADVIASQPKPVSDIERTSNESGVSTSAHEITKAEQTNTSTNMERISVDTATIEKATLNKEAQSEPVIASQAQSQTEKAIASSEQQQGLEVLREQSAEDVIYHAEMLKQADEIVSAIRGVDVACGGGSGSPLESIGELASDLFERDGKGKRGRGKKARTLREKLSKRRPSNPGSVVESASKNPVKRNKSFSLDYKQGAKGGGMLSKLGGGLKALGKGGALAGLFAGIDKIAEVKDRDDLSNSQKGAQVASTAVGAGGGAVAGGMAGAALGTMILPGVGTAVGGFIGSVMGGMGGESIGSTIGESISDFMGSDKSLSESISSMWSGFTSSSDEKDKTVTDVSNQASNSSAVNQVQTQQSDTATLAYTAAGAVGGAMTTTNRPEKASAIAAEAPQKRNIETNQSIKQMEQSNKHKEQASVVTLDARSTAAIEKLAQLGGNNTSTKKNPPQKVQKTSQHGEASSIPADFDNEYMRAVALDLD